MSTDDKPAPSDPPQARLEVKVGEVHIVLEGDPRFVTEAYDRVKGDITAAIAHSENPEIKEPVDFKETTDKLAVAQDLLWVYRCDEDMRTVYAVQRKKFAATALATAYGLGSVDRVYVDDERILNRLREGARTLWRELEPEGLRRIQEAAERAATKR